MEREELTKRSWKGYMTIIYQEDRMENPIECLLVGIDFDGETMTLCPMEDKYENTDFIANLKFCSIPKKFTELKVVKNGIKKSKL